MRDPDEPVAISRDESRVEVVTARSAMRVVSGDYPALAWDTLSKDGESWGHALAFCARLSEDTGSFVRALGLDEAAIREEDRGSRLFDMGVGCGSISMCIRTRDSELIAGLNQAEGSPLLANPDVMPLDLKAQPHRVLVSPMERIEVFRPIPAACAPGRTGGRACGWSTCCS